jgi:hypothetical protein
MLAIWSPILIQVKVLLLCWHLQNKQRRRGSSPILDELIDDALSEAEASEGYTPSPLAALPLAMYANTFEDSVWQCTYRLFGVKDPEVALIVYVDSRPCRVS